MNNIFYDIEDNCYRTYPDGDKANNKEIHKSIQKLQKENQELKQDIKNFIHIINHNCLELETTEEEYESLKRWNK